MRHIAKIFWIFSVFSAVLVRCAKETTCQLNIDDCEYKLTLLPSNKCHDSSFQRSRLKRSTTLNGQEAISLASKTDSLSKDFKRLEKKLVKEMRHLSTRVLRGTRKLETIAEDKLDNLGKKKRKCPEGFVSQDDWESCYLFSKFNTSWYTARDFCTALDSDLAALGSMKEHFLLSFLIKNNHEYRQFRGWWTSGTYVTKAKQWMWTSSKEMLPFTFVKWAVNEPNELHDQDLQCVMMYELDDLQWHDQICTDKYNFICEHHHK